MPKTASNKQKTISKKQGVNSKRKTEKKGNAKRPLKARLAKGGKAQSVKRVSRLTIPVINFDGKAGKTTLPAEIFGVAVKPQTLAQAVRVYLTNQRKGTVNSKTRSEVRGGGRKPWRQKGTGRARQGSIRAPHWRGGGVVFGPKSGEFELKLPKKAKKRALFGALSEKLVRGDICVVDNFEKIKPKTGELVKTLKKLKLPNKKVLLITNGNAQNLVRAARNLPDFKFLRVDNLTTYEILAAQNLIFTKKAIERLRERIL